MTEPTEWQCSCGAWVPVGYSHHPHVETQRATLAQMLEMRRAAESGLTGVIPDALDGETKVTRCWRTKESPTR